MLNIIFKNGRKTITKNNKRIQIRLSSSLYNDKDNSSNNKTPRNVKKKWQAKSLRKGKPAWPTSNYKRIRNTDRNGEGLSLGGKSMPFNDIQKSKPIEEIKLSFKDCDAVYNERRKSKHTFPDRKLFNMLAKKCFKANFATTFDKDGITRERSKRPTFLPHMYKYLNDMKENNITPDIEWYIPFIKLSGWYRRDDVVNMLVEDMQTNTKLLPHVECYNALLWLNYQNRGTHDKTIQLLYKMIYRENLEPNATTLKLIRKIYTQEKHLMNQSENDKIYHILLKYDIDNNALNEKDRYINLIQSLERNKEFHKVDLVVETMESKNMKIDYKTYRKLFETYAAGNKVEKVEECFEKMKNIIPNISLMYSMYNKLIDVYVRNRNVEKVESTLQEMKNEGFPDNNEINGVNLAQVTYNKIMKMYAKLNDSEKIEMYYNEMKNEYGLEINVFTYTTLIGIYGKMNDTEAVEYFIKEMQDNNIKFTKATYTALINFHGMIRHDWLQVQTLVDEMEKNRIKKDAPLYETLLTIHWYLGLKNDTLKESLPAIENLFAEMKRRHVYPTKKTYYILFKIFGMEKKFERINKLLEEVDNYGVKPDVVFYNNLLFAYARAGKHIKVDMYLKKMKQFNIAYDIATYDILINMYGGLGKFDTMINVFNEMQRNGVKPNVHIYNSLIKKYENAGDITKVKKHLQEMQEVHHIKPNGQTYGILIEMYSKHNQFDEIDECMKAMKKNNIEVGKKIYRILNEHYDMEKYFKKMK